MTSSSEQPKEYIITRAGLEEFYDALALANGKVYADKVWDLIERDNQSHPHPAPALFQIEPNSHNYTLGQIVEINENIQKQRAEAACKAREDNLIWMTPEEEEKRIRSDENRKAREDFATSLIEWFDRQVPKKDLAHPFYECKERAKHQIEFIRGHPQHTEHEQGGSSG